MYCGKIVIIGDRMEVSCWGLSLANIYTVFYCCQINYQSGVTCHVMMHAKMKLKHEIEIFLMRCIRIRHTHTYVKQILYIYFKGYMCLFFFNVI